MLFRYMYFAIKSWYIKKGEKDIPSTYAIGIISILLSFNIMALSSFISHKMLGTNFDRKQFVLPVLIIVLLSLFLYFHTIKKMQKLDPIQEIQKYSSNYKWLSIVYAILSLVLFFVL